MRKIAALGMIAITIAVNMTPVTAKAAGVYSYNQCYGGTKAVTISGNCSLDELKSKLQEYGIDGNCVDWAKTLDKQNCSLNSAQNDCNANTNATPYVSNTNTACNNSQLPEAVQNAQALQNQANCSKQAEVVNTPVDTTQASKEQENTTAEAQTAEDKAVVNTTKNTNTSKTDTSTTDTSTKTIKDTANTNTTKTNTSKETTTNNSINDNKTESSYIQQVVDLVNVERAKEGLAPLTIDKKVEQAAMVRAKEIQTKFEHVRPNGSGFVTALKEQGVTYRGAGENIAWGQRTPEEVVNAWMNSPGHRANIMNKNYVNIGVGNLQNSAGTQYWVQIFTY